MHYKILIVSLLIPFSVLSKSPPKIGIIGGGIAGTSCAYFLNDLFQNKASISLFEKDKIGGRLRIMNIDGIKYEAGGSVIHPRNQYMVQFSKLLGLVNEQPDSNTFGLYDGEKIVFEESAWKFVNVAKMLWRYGISILTLFDEIKSMLSGFSSIYSTQENGYSYTSVNRLLDSINPSFTSMTQSSIGSILQKRGYSGKFLDELVQSIMMVNYGQTNNISGFAGFVSLAGVDDNLWHVEGGNYLIPEGILEKSKADFIHGEVFEVILLPDATFELKYKEDSPDSEVKSENFDIIVLSAPLIKGSDNIKFVNFEKNFQQFERTYHQIVTTFIKGTIKPQAFHEDKVPDDILTNNNTLPFNTIARKINSAENVNEQDTYKIFSHNPLKKDYIEKLFHNVQVVEEKVWLAYPHYKPPEKLVPFILHPGLYYTSAIELSASAMEMSAISAKNVALLIFNLWKNLLEKIDNGRKQSKDEL